MQPILLGIPGLEYQGGFMECETNLLLSLMNSIERGASRRIESRNILTSHGGPY
ncbi:hypothetical protein [Vulcanisaeta distributa]|uniref:hypothetical protein n=1 Tax=Vulcanisaeta distributa TaxID=164451 RepID=UPI000AFF2336|nr:hypothetical protein [Vulcanisaeta distributa]